jgi:hypothetical protein
MKTCISCQHKKESAFQLPDGRLQMMFVCMHEECIDPVAGDPVPCSSARRDPIFCGVNGRYWKEKDKEPPKGNVIELAK